MAKPPSEPAHAPGGVQNGARPPGAAAGISSRGLLPQRRATSSSLLTKLLAPTYEVDESTADAVAVNADAAVGDDELLKRTQRRERLPRETKDMAAQTMRPLSPPQQAARYNLHDMNISHVNALLHDHRAFLRSTRVRGNSLERTSREKMGATAASLAQRDVSGGTMTNPGDTGYTYTRPATDGEDIAPGDISERPPTEGFRAEYRSWRDGQRMPGAGMAWSIGGETLSPGEDGQVEKSITQALAGETHNSRSRKSSHSVRLFKEGLPDETARRSRLRDEKGAGGEGAGELAQMKGEEKLSPIAGSTEQTPAEDGSGSYFDLPIVEPTSTAPPTSRHHTVAGRMSRANTTGKPDESPRRPERQNTLPAQLLDDLRSRHNLTPAATKGSSFSNSIPLTDSERQSTADLSISVPSDDSTAPATSGDEKPRTESPNSDEESSEEKISSALFVPHQSSREPGDESPHHTPPCREPLKDRRERGVEEEQWLVEHEVAPTHEVVEKDVTPANLSPELVSPRSRTASGYFSQTSSNTLSSSDASYPSAKGEEQVPVAQEQGEDVDITPMERKPSLQDYTVKTRERAPTQDSAQQQPSPKAAGPLEAIELIPYKHQVGGHTTLWRFSKRAVCKQLNNRENQFYETVEHYHPALLKFMPRYVFFLFTHPPGPPRCPPRAAGGLKLSPRRLYTLADLVCLCACRWRELCVLIGFVRNLDTSAS
jgi:inositol-hexakisphosphate kinase